MPETDKDKKWENGESYDRYITKELASFRKEAWKHQIGQHFAKDALLNILDVGTGPGFFACILAEEGHKVTAIDQSEGMIAYARVNAKKLGVKPRFIKMDINKPTFDDDSFDVIISRNVTWTLEHPEEVYTAFKRMLKPGGQLLIYDANWHMHFFDDEMMERVRAREKRHFNKYGSIEMVTDNDCDYFTKLPLSNIRRPQWDVITLSRLGFVVEIEEDIGKKVYEEWEKELYGESPLFEICAVKQMMNEDRARVQNYWQNRSASFEFGLSDEAVEEWRTRIKRHLPEGRLRVLDVGTGPGFMAAVMSMLGHDVTGVDLCSKMIERAKANAESTGLTIRFMCTDAGELPFADETFDVVVCRNVLWALTNPKEVIAQWRRVLKPGRILMYFDGNHYYYLYNDRDRKTREAYIVECGDPHENNCSKGFDSKEMETAAKKLPLSMVSRPEWDISVLPSLGYDIVYLDVKKPEEKQKRGDKTSSCYYSTFMIVAKKLTTQYCIGG